MRVQEYLTCAIQNIQVLIAYVAKPKKAVAARMIAMQKTTAKAFGSIIESSIPDLSGLCSLIDNLEGLSY